MDEFFSNLFGSNPSPDNFSGSRTVVPGPSVIPARNQPPVILSQNQDDHVFARPPSRVPSYPRPPLAPRNVNGEPVPPTQTQRPAPPSAPSSILRADMNQMIAWLTQGGAAQPIVNSPYLNLNSQMNSEVYTSEDLEKRIPKPYIELTEQDCAGVVARAMGSIILYTCNNDFRRGVFKRLTASNSRDVTREVNARLCAIIQQDQAQPEEENQENRPTDFSNPIPLPSLEMILDGNYDCNPTVSNN